MNYAGLYCLVLIAYLPGLLVIASSAKVWKFPVLVFTFLGMFLFNALGSGGVFIDEKIYKIEFDSRGVSEALALLLIFQVLAYYLIVGAYLILKEPPLRPFKTCRRDLIVICLGLASIVAIVALYFQETSTFPVLLVLEGLMNVDTAFQYREVLVYGLLNWPFYSLGFVFLPVFISNYVFLKAKSEQRLGLFFFVSMGICFGASLLLGSKAGVINFVLSLSIAYAVHVGLAPVKQSRWKINKRFIVFVLFAIVLMVVGYIQATPESLSFISLLERLWYRAFVTYPETIAGAVSYVQEHGFFGVEVFPTMRGFFSHERVILSAVLHQYMASAPGGMNVPFIAEAYVSYGWWGVVTLCPLIFVVLILLQEFSFRIRPGISSLAFMSFYSYMAILVSVLGMFSTLFTFMFPMAILMLFLTAWAIERIVWPRGCN